MTLVPPADAALGADAPEADPAEVLGDDRPVDAVPETPTEAPYTGTDAVTLAIVCPHQISYFASGVDGWDDITPEGTSGPGSTATQVIAAGLDSGITIENR